MLFRNPLARCNSASGVASSNLCDRAGLPYQAGAFLCGPTRHPEVRAERASKDDQPSRTRIL